MRTESTIQTASDINTDVLQPGNTQVFALVCVENKPPGQEAITGRPVYWNQLPKANKLVRPNKTINVLFLDVFRLTSVDMNEIRNTHKTFALCIFAVNLTISCYYFETFRAITERKQAAILNRSRYGGPLR
jgi:hypothetical protein